MCHFSAPKKASSHDWLNSYLLRVFGLQPRLDHGIWSNVGKTQMAVCQNLVPLVNIKIAGKWMFIPLKMVLIGIDPYPNQPPVGYYQFLYSMVFYATIDGFWFTSSSFHPKRVRCFFHHWRSNVAKTILPATDRAVWAIKSDFCVAERMEPLRTARAWSKHECPLINSQFAMENWLFIVDLPIKHGDFPSFFVGLPEGTYLTSENSRSSSPTLVTGAPRHLFFTG